jgi:hypothetical protein
MPYWQWLLLSLGVMVALHAGFVLALVVAGCRTDARALGGFIPDAAVLFKRLLADPRLPLRRKLVLGGLVAYLASPLDLLPAVYGWRCGVPIATCFASTGQGPTDRSR